MNYIPFNGLTSNRIAALDKHFKTMPTQYQGLASSGLFKSVGIATKNVLVEEREGVLYVIKSNADQSPAKQNESGKRNLLQFATNFHKVDDIIHPDDIQGFGGFDSEEALLMTENEELAERVETISMSHDLTEERHISSVLQGRLLNSDGSVLYDAYRTFGLKRSDYEINVGLSVSTTSINDKLNELAVKMSKSAKGEIFREIHVRCNLTFMNNLVKMPDVRAMFDGSPMAMLAIKDYNFGDSPFVLPNFPKIKFFLYVAEGDDGTGNNIQFLPDPAGEHGRAFAYPVGTRDSFRLYRSPARRFGQINRKPTGNGRWMYVKKHEDGSKLEIQTENNFIPIPMRPRMLYQLQG